MAQVKLEVGIKDKAVVNGVELCGPWLQCLAEDQADTSYG